MPPWTFPTGTPPRSVISGTASKTSSIRFHDAMPRCSMFVTQPKAIIGQVSITKYALNATNSPTVICPRITSRLPSHNTSNPPKPRNIAKLG